MYVGRVARWGLVVVILSVDAHPALGDDDIKVMKHAYVQDSRGACMVAVEDKVKFQEREPPGILWDVVFLKSGFRIVETETGKILGIDAKLKELALFRESGPTTTWQLKAAGQSPMPNRSFKAIMYMRIDGEELRIWTDEAGKTTLGGKATLIRFDRWSP